MAKIRSPPSTKLLTAYGNQTLLLNYKQFISKSKQRAFHPNDGNREEKMY